MMDKKDPFMIFDWYFADVSKKDASRYHALKERQVETSVLMALTNANSLIHFALWSELPKNHPVAELWLETETDFQASIYLAYGGFFRQALTILRSWFEITIHAIFFAAHYGQPNGRYEQWRVGQRKAPANMKVIAESLSSRTDKLVNVDKDTIFNRVGPIYSFLSQNTHAQGLDIYDLQKGRDNVPRYLSKSFDIWYNKVLEVFDTFCFLHRIFYLKEMISYFKKSKEKRECVEELTKILSGVLPDFNSLMNEVLKNV